MKTVLKYQVEKWENRQARINMTNPRRKSHPPIIIISTSLAETRTKKSERVTVDRVAEAPVQSRENTPHRRLPRKLQSAKSIVPGLEVQG